MSKNNPKTMNKRTHHPFKSYEKNKATNSNHQTSKEEFGEEFDERQKRLNQSSKVRNKQTDA